MNTEDKLETMTIRTDKRLLEQTDKVLARVQRRFPNMTKSEVIRAAWMEGLKHVEKMFR